MLQASGVKVSDQCQVAFDEVKMAKKSKYVIFKINDEKTSIVVDSAGGATETYDDFKSKLPADDCRYGIIDFGYVLPDGRENSKILFVFWCVHPNWCKTFLGRQPPLARATPRVASVQTPRLHTRRYAFAFAMLGRLTTRPRSRRWFMPLAKRTSRSRCALRRAFHTLRPNRRRIHKFR
jgi:hypothetical protein